MSTHLNDPRAGSESRLEKWDVVQGVSGLMVLLAIIFSWANLFPLWNRITVLRNRAAYRPATFVVTGAFYDRSGEHGPDYWLTGMVGAKSERLVPHGNDRPKPDNVDDLLRMFPKETKLDVLYNPAETEALVQDESLRVFEARPNFWQDEERSLVRWGMRAFLPLAASLTLYTAIRYVRSYRRARRDGHARGDANTPRERP